MAERPILFSGEMVRAILAGRKTMTRRPVTRPRMVGGDLVDPEFWEPKRPGVWQVYHPDLGETIEVPCPIALPGDLLWVRETWAALDAEWRPVPWPRDLRDGPWPHVAYRADHIDPRGDGPAHPMRWRPSLLMPRWASRISRPVVSVRLERVQDITEEDARAEGVNVVPFYPADGFPLCDGHMAGDDDGKSILYPTAREAFRATWRDCYGPESWDADPWIWRIAFERTEAPAREGGR